MSWLADLPKVELHLHLEGSMSVETVRNLAQRHQVDPTTVWPDGLPEQFSFVDFPDFAAQFFFGLSLLRSGDDIATIAEALAVTLAAQNVRYAEVTTTAYTHFMDRPDRSGLSAQEYTEGLDEGRRRARAKGVDINWIIDIPRDIEMPDSFVTINYLLSSNVPDGLVGLGLGGYEVGFPAAPYTPHFARAKAAGLNLVPHAGETLGPESIRSALDDLKARRIGHGVRCIEDPELVKRIADEGVMLEICPTSNERLGVVDNLADHPLPLLFDAGVRVCINTDDPGWFATDLMTELSIALDLLGGQQATLRAIQLDALMVSFASPAQKAEIRHEIQTFDQPPQR